MTTIEKIIAYITEICSDKRYYYSQNRKLYEGYAVDCSSLILRGISLGGGLPIGSATYTGNMVTELCNTGNFVCMPFDISKAVRGDIFIRHEHDNIGHTVLYLGNRKIAEACSSKIGLRITDYYFNRYQYILRLKEGYSGKMATIKKGDICVEVGLLQLFLNKYQGNKLIIDCDFGPKTQEALKNFQIKYNLEVDGIAGVETWTKIYFIMAASS